MTIDELRDQIRKDAALLFGIAVNEVRIKTKDNFVVPAAHNLVELIVEWMSSSTNHDERRTTHADTVQGVYEKMAEMLRGELRELYRDLHKHLGGVVAP